MKRRGLLCGARLRADRALYLRTPGVLSEWMPTEDTTTRSLHPHLTEAERNARLTSTIGRLSALDSHRDQGVASRVGEITWKADRHAHAHRHRAAGAERGLLIVPQRAAADRAEATISADTSSCSCAQA